MSLASLFSHDVPARVRRRGAEYFGRDLVKLSLCTASRVEATVQGTEEYEVALERENVKVWAVCTCPFFTDRGALCKHIWAVVLAADAEGGLRGPRGGLPSFLASRGVNRLDGLVVDEENELEPEELGLPAAEAADSQPPHAPEPATPPPGWRDFLVPISTASALQGVRDVEILYVLDLPASLKRQGLSLDILTFNRTKDGQRGALRQLRITRGQIAALRHPEDRALLSLLLGAMRGDAWSSWYYSQHQELPLEPWVPDELAQEVAQRLCATGRCHLRERPNEIGETALRWDDKAPWELWLAVRETDDGSCEVVPELRRGDSRIRTRGLIVLEQAGLIVTRDVLAPIDAGGARSFLPLLRLPEPLRVPAADREDLLATILEAPSLPRLDLPESLRHEEATVTPQPRLRLLPPPVSVYTFQNWPEARLSFLYEGCEVQGRAHVRGVYRKEGRRFLLRDPESEEPALARLTALGFRPLPDGSSHEPKLRIAPTRVPDVVRTLLAEGWSVEAQGKLYRAPGRFQVSVASGIDWFELHGDVEFAGEVVSLPRLLAALRQGGGFVPLGDGSLGILPEEWLKRWAPLAKLGEAAGDHVRFQPPQAVLLDAWLAEEPEATCDETFSQARVRLRSFAGITAEEAPAGFHGVLRPYQQLGLGWLSFLRDFGLGGCLADDMGLGKTVQVLAFLAARRERRAADRLPPSLLVVPRSLVFNWLAEAERFTPELRLLDYTGAGRAQGGMPFADADVVITTYGTLRRDIASLKEADFDYVILDEAQAIKNANSQTAKAARLLRGRHRLALTGTPIENHLGELWSLLEFLNPGFLGASALQARASELRDPGAAARQVLGRAIRPLILRRTKEQVATELPQRVEQTLVCELPPKQRKLYDELRTYYRAVLDKQIGTLGMGRSKLLALEALLRLRQAACHPALLDRGRAEDPCAKLDLLVPTLREVLEEGHKALVFSQFTSFLALLQRQLESAGMPYLYLDGQTRDRQARVEEFQSESGPALFLISLKAGGLGLNLTAADYVYLLDPWWNPAVEAQAVDRAHRIGQNRTVFAYRLVARDTVEEKILELQAGKRALADAIIQADQSLMARLSREDLELLLS